MPFGQDVADLECVRGELQVWVEDVAEVLQLNDVQDVEYCIQDEKDAYADRPVREALT